MAPPQAALLADSEAAIDAPAAGIKPIKEPMTELLTIVGVSFFVLPLLHRLPFSPAPGSSAIVEPLPRISFSTSIST